MSSKSMRTALLALALVAVGGLLCAKAGADGGEVLVVDTPVAASATLDSAGNVTSGTVANASAPAARAGHGHGHSTKSFKENVIDVFTKKLRPGQPEFNMLFPMLFAYWGLAVIYDVLSMLPFQFIRRYRVERKVAFGRGNPMTKWTVIGRVILQHTIQTVMGVGLMCVDPDMCKSNRAPESLAQRGVRFVLAMFIMDSYQYWVHRLMHDNKFLYRHLHSKHHSLVIPYAYGALYNSILEGFILDSAGGVITHYLSGMDCNTASVMLTFATCKTVLDHCNFRFPVNPIHDIFPNSTAFHDVHHDVRWGTSNLSQPFFTHWDYLFGTFIDPNLKHMTPTEVDAKDTGKKSQ